MSVRRRLFDLQKKCTREEKTFISVEFGRQALVWRGGGCIAQNVGIGSRSKHTLCCGGWCCQGSRSQEMCANFGIFVVKNARINSWGNGTVCLP